MRHLSIDLETFSSVDIQKAGAHAYVRSPDFQILLNGYQFWGEMEKPVVLDYTEGEVLPQWFIN
ncbi:MAG: DNA polymerase, partial [Ruminococcus sp.]|nr:DNA polymerase [Ruminococcus sp.]